MSTTFLLTALAVVAAPGTGVVFTLATAVDYGRRGGLLAAMGCTLGVLPHLLAASLVLSGLVTTGDGVLTIVRAAGIAYLAWIGVGMLRRGGDTTSHEDDEPTVVSAAATDVPPAGMLLRQAVLLNLLNPKLLLFFLAFLPQFLDHPPTPLDPSVLAMSATFMLLTLVVFAGYAVAADAGRQLLRDRRSQHRLRRSLGATMLLLASRLVVEV